MLSNKTTFNFRVLLLALLPLCCLLSACLKEDKLIPKPNIVYTENTIPMGSNYSQQFFYDLKQAKAVKEYNKVDWDLRFQSNGNYYIFLNSAKFMRIAHTGSTQFNNVTSSAGLHFSFDYPNGALDSNAIGKWGDFSGSAINSYKEVYVIDRGLDALGNNLGMKKMVITGFSSNAYQIRFANLDGTDDHIISVAKDSSYNYTYFNFNDGGTTPIIEPPKTDWDLWFTQYSTWLYDVGTNSYIEYLVVGVMINPNATEVAFDTSNRFNDISLLEAQAKHYYHNWDIIGYGWKNPNLSGGSAHYTVYSNVTYMVHTQHNEYFKLRFIDFYNQSGEKGYPKFDQLQL